MATEGSSEEQVEDEGGDRYFFLSTWKRFGHHRMYLRDPEGERLGWTDLKTNTIHLECEEEEAGFAKALLEAADPTGIKLAPGDLPKVAGQLWGGRLLSRIVRLHASVLVGQEWRAFGKHRLYGTLIDPLVTTFDLGYVDLATEEIHPSSTDDVSADRESPEHYLAELLERFPRKDPGA